ncbi:uncharacterized protein LOC108104106 [Drosophila eugracilis]|uniref:uncharacterized protein LOC108104106 n=1 Tax=Drosophila eugracilis TaxID=29029 RepID=UPI001BD99DA9|nr:uncharacterized protein LOC108104106 [Drosophila eugracilis]
MTIAKWYKWSAKDFEGEPQNRPKLIPGFDRLDDRLRSVLREQDARKNSLKRKQAGGGQNRLKFKKAKRTNKQVPRVWDYQKVYTEKRKDLKILAHNQRKESQFRSSPVPDFQRSHQLLEKRKIYLNSLQKVTKPRCPSSLVAPIEAFHKRKKEEREHSKMSDFIPKINPGSSMDYLNRPPFIPQVESTYTRTKPFRLHTSERAFSRRLYDERKRMRMDLQMEQRINDWYKQQRAEYIKIRKMTNFKATANPWRRRKITAGEGTK